MGMFGFVKGSRRRTVILIAAASAVVVALAGTVVALNRDDGGVKISSGDTSPTTHDHEKMLRDQAAAAAAQHNHGTTPGSTGAEHDEHADHDAGDDHHATESTAQKSSSSHAHNTSNTGGSVATSHSHSQSAAANPPASSGGHAHNPSPGGGSSTPTTHGHHSPGSTTPGSTKPPDPDGPPRSSAEQQLLNATRAAVAKIPNNEAGVLAAGYQWIGDEAGGYRHYVNWTYYFDGVEMNPNAIESLVMKRYNGVLRIETAMYILNHGKTMSQVPTIPGTLISWHNHTNLCWRGDFTPPVDPSDPPRLAGCGSPGAVHIVTPPMVHLWMKYNPPNPLVVQCGPFVGVDGHGAGCNHSH